MFGEKVGELTIIRHISYDRTNGGFCTNDKLVHIKCKLVIRNYYVELVIRILGVKLQILRIWAHVSQIKNLNIMILVSYTHSSQSELQP